MVNIPILEYNYDLPEERIAKFPLAERDASKLLVYRHICRCGLEPAMTDTQSQISETIFNKLGDVLPQNSLVVFNNTRVVRARLIMHRTTGGRVEIFCLEPCEPADYERAFAARGKCRWHCIIGGGRRWKEDAVSISLNDRNSPLLEGNHLPKANDGENCSLRAFREQGDIVRFEWDASLTFGQLLEQLGRTPIPPYLRRESEAIDEERYQTVYARWEGSVAAPTAGLHFTKGLIDALKVAGTEFETVTLHVGAGTFLPVKGDDAAQHPMHTEHFEVRLDALQALIPIHRRDGIYEANDGVDRKIVAVGTTTMRTLESLSVLGWRIRQAGAPDETRPIGQWEAYDIPADATGLLEELIKYMRRNGLTSLNAATQIMIRPGFKFRVVDALITNFHQPKSTLLLLVSAFVGEDWKRIYEYALSHDFRFLSYGDSSILFRN